MSTASNQTYGLLQLGLVMLLHASLMRKHVSLTMEVAELCHPGVPFSQGQRHNQAHQGHVLCACAQHQSRSAEGDLGFKLHMALRLCELPPMVKVADSEAVSLDNVGVLLVRSVVSSVCAILVPCMERMS